MNQDFVQTAITATQSDNPYRTKKDIEILDLLKERGLIENHESIPILKTTRVGWGQEEGQTKQHEATLTEFGLTNIDDPLLREAILRGIKLRRAKF